MSGTFSFFCVFEALGLAETMNIIIMKNNACQEERETICYLLFPTRLSQRDKYKMKT